MGIVTVLTTSVLVLTLSNQVFALSMQNGKIRSQVAGTHSPGKHRTERGTRDSVLSSWIIYPYLDSQLVILAM